MRVPKSTCLVAALLATVIGMAAAGRSLQECPPGAAGVACFCLARGKAGYFADVSTGCKSYYWCTGGDQGSFYDCGAETLFNEVIGFCDYPTNVHCGGAPAAAPTPQGPSQAGPAPTVPQVQPKTAPAANPAAPTPSGPSQPAATSASSSCTSTDPSPPGATGVTGLISPKLWCEIFVHSGDDVCSPHFYTYEAFVAAAGAFPTFANSSPDNATNRRELAAFLAQISHETTGGPATNNQYDWGLCFKEELGSPSDYCVQDPAWPCAANVSYHGRGPVQLSYNYKYQPSDDDKKAGRLPGFGLTINIINGGLECGPDNANKDSAAAKAADRIAYYRRYAGLLGVDPGDNLDCASQIPYVVPAMPTTRK